MIKIKIPDIGDILIRNKTSDIIKQAYHKLTPSQEGDFFEVEGAKIYLKEYSRLMHEDDKPPDHEEFPDGYYPCPEDYGLIVVGFNESMECYSNGFKHGYFNFESEIVEDRASIFVNDSVVKSSIIFDFVNDNSFCKYDMVSRIGADRDYVQKGIYKHGLSRGYMYRAWNIILDNQKLFEPLFTEPKQKEATMEMNKNKTFISYLKHSNPKQLAQKIKTEFVGKKGKPIALLIHCLKESNCLIDEKIYKQYFYNAMANYFQKSIGADSAMNKHNDKNMIFKYLNHVRIEYKITQNKLKKILDSI